MQNSIMIPIYLKSNYQCCFWVPHTTCVICICENHSLEFSVLTSDFRLKARNTWKSLKKHSLDIYLLRLTWSLMSLIIMFWVAISHFIILYHVLTGFWFISNQYTEWLVLVLMQIHYEKYWKYQPFSKKFHDWMNLWHKWTNKGFYLFWSSPLTPYISGPYQRQGQKVVKKAYFSLDFHIDNVLCNVKKSVW